MEFPPKLCRHGRHHYSRGRGIGGDRYQQLLVEDNDGLWGDLRFYVHLLGSKGFLPTGWGVHGSPHCDRDIGVGRLVQVLHVSFEGMSRGPDPALVRGF